MRGLGMVIGLWPVCLLAAEYEQVKTLFEALVGFDPQTSDENARAAYGLM